MMEPTARGGALLSNSELPTNTLNFLQTAKGALVDRAGQTASAITETADKVRASLPGVSETVMKQVSDTGNQVIGKGAATVGSARTAIMDSAEKTLNGTLYKWLDTHPFISWLLTHPLYTIGAVLLFLLLLSGLLRAFGRMTEQVWLFVLHSPLKLGRWFLGVGAKAFSGRSTATPQNTSQARLIEILSRLEAIRKEQDTLMHEIETILALDKK